MSLLVLTVGVLALAAATAVIARQVNGGARLMLAAAMAQSRFERLRAQDCTRLTGGAATLRGISERWTASSAGGGVTITDTITFESGRAIRVHAFASLIPCPGAVE